MTSERANASWDEALALYDSLVGPKWQHIPRFRDLVALIAISPAASGLTAVTSHETLIVSPYTRHPDWFEGRHVRVHPLADGTIRVERHPERPDRSRAENWTLSPEDARHKILELMTGL